MGSPTTVGEKIMKKNRNFDVEAVTFFMFVQMAPVYIIVIAHFMGL